MSENVDDVLGIAPETEVPTSPIDDRMRFFRSRYADAYNVAKGLRMGQWFVAGGTALAVIGCLLIASEGTMGSVVFGGFAVVTGIGGALGWFSLGAAAAFIRVLIDVAVHTAPGLSDEERLAPTRTGVRSDIIASSSGTEHSTHTRGCDTMPENLTKRRLFRDP